MFQLIKPEIPGIELERLIMKFIAKLVQKCVTLDRYM